MQYKIIGHPVPRHDAWEKVKGNTVYADDYMIPGMLYGKVLRSKYPAAKILSIDIKKAEILDGVKAVITAKDVPNNDIITRLGQSKEVGKGFEEHFRVLADQKVRFIGEAIALVAAETEEIAKEAIELIKIDYEPLPGVFDPIKALKPDAYCVGESDTNKICQYQIKKGDIEKGFQEADLIIENIYHVPFVDHAYLELESAVGWIDENGVITIRTCTQIIEHYREIADMLNYPYNKIRIIGTMLGGGFGGKSNTNLEHMVALLTWKTERAVKLTYTREESILAHSKRHPYVMKYKTGATKDGKLLALKAELIADAGAYSCLSTGIALYSTVNAAGPYNIPNVQINTTAVLTNNTPCGAMRGFGAPQPNFAYESQIDEIANKLDRDPLEIRRMNCFKTNDVLPSGSVLDHHVALPEVAEKAWKTLNATPRRELIDKNRKVGRGLAIGMMAYGRMLFFHDSARSYIKVELDGSVIIKCGVPDVGGGQASALCQITSEILGIPMGKITIYCGDTSLNPLAGSTTATRQLYMSGNATLMAAQKIKERLLKQASFMLRKKPEELDLFNEQIIMKDSGDELLSIKKVIVECSNKGMELFCESQFNAPKSELPDVNNINVKVFQDFTFGAHAVEVSVDKETGEVDVLKVISSFDVGKVINPLSVEGQLEGGTVFGLGYALTEEVIIEEGKIRTPSLTEYLIPTSSDVPDIETIITESFGGAGPFGAKGIGEPSCNSIAPAIANAIFDAVGVRIKQLPATPEKIIKCLGKI